MWNKPSSTELQKLPKLYETENTELKDKKIFLHFFLGGSDWYAAEFDGKETFFGFAVLNNDLDMAEWGYFSLSELCSVKLGFAEVDRDLYWDVRKASEVKQIAEANGV